MSSAGSTSAAGPTTRAASRRPTGGTPLAHLGVKPAGQRLEPVDHLVAVGVFFGYVHRRLRDNDRASALPTCLLVAAGGVVSLALAGALLQGTLAQHTGSGIDDSALLLLHRTWTIVAFMGPPLLMGTVLLLGGSRSIRTGVFPRWLGWIAIVSAFAGVATALTSLGTSTRPPAVLDVGSFLLAAVWCSGISIHAVVRSPHPAMTELATAP
jgi:hypothetical protein